MNFFAIVPLTSFSICLVAGILVFQQNRKSSTNRTLSLYCLLGAYYGMVEFGLIQARGFDEALFWRQAGAIWLFAPALLLHFVLILTERREWLDKKRIYALIYLPALVFSLVDLATHAVLGKPEEFAWGWAYGISDYIFLPALVFLWAVGMGFISVYLCWHYYRSSTEAISRRNVKYVLGGLVLPLVALLTVDGMLPEFDIRTPEFASAALALGIAFIAYGILRHNIFTITPAIAAESIIATMSDALLLVDTQKRIVMVNQAALDLLKRKERQLLYQPLTMIFNSSTAIVNKDSVRAVLSMKSGDSIEAVMVANDGRLILVSVRMSEVHDSYGNELGRVYVCRDVTERKRMEETLLLRDKAIENAVSAIAMSDIEGKITYVNRACIRLWGGDDRDELIGRPYWIMIKSVEDVRSIAASMFEKKYWEGELVAMRKDGQEVYVYVYAGMVEDEQGKPIQTISSFVDITEQKQKEEEKIRMEQQLQLAGRLAAVGELAAGVAHELNNPLAAVQAFAQFLVERQDLNKQVRNDVETIFKESQRASKITSNLLSFARRHKPQKEIISINEVIKKSLELHAYRLKINNIEVVMELDPDLPQILADFHQLEQVFVNIIANAEQAMTEAHGKGILCIETLHRDNRVRIIFRDDGPGIVKENLKQLFDPFFTTKAVGKGTGLGLSICFGIIQDHNGYIYADSAIGKGATFTVEIPVVSEKNIGAASP